MVLLQRLRNGDSRTFHKYMTKPLVNSRVSAGFMMNDLSKNLFVFLLRPCCLKYYNIPGTLAQHIYEYVAYFGTTYT